MVTGTISLFDTDALVLVDSGATHSFISRKFIERVRIKMRPTECSMVVSLPMGDSLIANRVYVRTPPRAQPLVVSPLTGIVLASPSCLFLASVRARTQDHRDIIEMGSTLTTNWATSSVGSESAPYFNDVLVVLGSSSHEGEKKARGTCQNNTCEW